MFRFWPVLAGANLFSLATLIIIFFNGNIKCIYEINLVGGPGTVTFCRWRADLGRRISFRNSWYVWEALPLSPRRITGDIFSQTIGLWVFTSHLEDLWGKQVTFSLCGREAAPADHHRIQRPMAGWGRGRHRRLRLHTLRDACSSLQSAPIVALPVGVSHR